jgi:hypothetical protein
MPPETLAPEAAPAEELATLGFGPDEDDLQAEEDASRTEAAEVEFEEPSPIEASGVVIALFANAGKAAEYVNQVGTVGDYLAGEADIMGDPIPAYTIGEPIFTARGRGRVRMYLPIHLTVAASRTTGGDLLRQLAYHVIGDPARSPLSIRVEVSR